MGLREEGYDVTEGECPDCEDGTLYVNSFELVCQNCLHVFRKSSSEHSVGRQSVESDSFYDNRDDHEYENGSDEIGAGEIRMPGGFDEAYDIYLDNGIYGEKKSAD